MSSHPRRLHLALTLSAAAWAALFFSSAHAFAGVDLHSADLPAATREAIAKAESGDGKFERWLADALRWGQAGLPQNLAEAATWLRRGAERGDAESQAELAALYSGSWGTDATWQADVAESIRWHKKAAENGVSASAMHLGANYGRGTNGFTRDDVESFKWYLAAARQSNEYGEFSVGTCYLAGSGVAMDRALGIRWIQRAAAHGNSYARQQLTALGAPLVDPEAETHPLVKPPAAVVAAVAGQSEFDAGQAAANANDYAKAFAQWTSAAKLGNTDAMYGLGVLYEYGEGVEPSLRTAKEWFEKARANGSKRAEEGIKSVDELIATGGLEFEAGQRAVKTGDYELAKKSWTVAVEKGSAEAMFNLGVLRQNGWGLPCSYVEARAWFARAQQGGVAGADKSVQAMGELIAKGGQDGLDGVAAYEAGKFPEAFRLLTSGANKGDNISMFWLGTYHESGVGGKADPALAITWYEKAAAAGHPDAKAAAEDVRADSVGADEYDKGKAAYDAKKFTEAVSWYEKAANLGNVRAMSALGALYMDGAGEIFDDRTKAKFWLTKAFYGGAPGANLLLKTLESTDALAAMVARPKEPPAKGPSLIKGSPWTGDEILAALRKGADHMSLAIALRVDGAELYYGDTLAIRFDSAAASIVEHGRLSNALSSGAKPIAGAWARDQAKAAIAARRQQVALKQRPADSVELRTKSDAGDPAAAYALFSMPSAELKLGERTGASARNYEDMAKLAREKNYEPALWVAAEFLVNQPDKSHNDPVKQAEYLQRSAAAGDAQGAYKYAQLFVAPGEVAVAPNFAAAEYWFIEAGARERPGEFTVLPPELALALLYSAKQPIGFQGADVRASESSVRWCQELIRRGGPGAGHAQRVLELWRRERNGAAVVDALLKKAVPEEPEIPAAEVAKLDAAARDGNAAAAMKLGGAFASGRGVLQHDARAVEYYRLAAAKGSREAMRALATQATRGWGMKKDARERVAWLEQAGAAGDAAAWLEVADLHQFSNDTDVKLEDFAKARAAYEKALAGGEFSATLNFAILHDLGRGVPKDSAKAIELLRLGAEKGVVPAMARLALKLYETKDYAGALPWFEKAIAAGDQDSVAQLGPTLKALGETDRAIDAYRKWLELHSDDFRSRFELASQLEKQGDLRAAIDSYREVASNNSKYNFYKDPARQSAERLAEELNPKPGGDGALRQRAEAGDVDAMMLFAMRLAPTDKPKAFEWVKKAAAKEHPQAMLVLGLETAATDKPAGLALIEKAANAGNLEAKFRLGAMKLQGTETAKDVAGGLKWITEAADGGLPYAQVELGRALLVGAPEIPADPPRGLGYLQKAAVAGVPQAAGLLGEVYERGVGVAADPRQALKWYEQAVRGGIKEAAASVARVQQSLGVKPPPEKR